MTASAWETCGIWILTSAVDAQALIVRDGKVDGLYGQGI